MTREVKRFKWSELQSSGGAENVPKAMEDLAKADDKTEAERAYWRIDGTVVQNSSLLAASLPTTICLLSHLQECTRIARPFILELLVQISSACSEDGELNKECSQLIYEGVSQYFFILEYGRIEEKALCLDLIGNSCEFNENLKPRVRWWLKIFLSEVDLDEGIKKFAENWLNELV